MPNRVVSYRNDALQSETDVILALRSYSKYTRHCINLIMDLYLWRYQQRAFDTDDDTDLT
jgi:hypothetical protein